MMKGKKKKHGKRQKGAREKELEGEMKKNKNELDMKCQPFCEVF